MLQKLKKLKFSLYITYSSLLFSGSDSDFSYRSFVSAGGTRHVKRRRKRADGTYSAEESYHSSQDAEGQERRK